MSNEKMDDLLQCPFCRTALNEGATACSGCGARRESKNEAKRCFGIIEFAIIIIFSIVTSYSIHPLFGIGGGLAIIIGYFIYLQFSQEEGYTDRWIQRK